MQLMWFGPGLEKWMEEKALGEDIIGAKLQRQEGTKQIQEDD